MSLGLMATPAAVSACSRSAMEMSDLSGLCERSRQTASRKKFSSGTSSIVLAPGRASKWCGAST